MVKFCSVVSCEVVVCCSGMMGEVEVVIGG